MSPRVSVVMSVYNGVVEYLGEAIESILNQTFTDFEFIIIDDGSRDNSLAILSEYARNDHRIRIIQNRYNQGLSVSLNKGIRAARGEYIARMDADDLCHPDRLTSQVAFMDTHNEVAICGTWVAYFGCKDDVLHFPASHEAIFTRMFFENALAHPSVMIRAATLAQRSLQYDEQILFAQDYELWSRAIKYLTFENLERVLLFYRVHASSIGAVHLERQRRIQQRAYRNMLRMLQIDCTPEELRLHAQISSHQIGKDKVFLRKSRRWLERLSQANKRIELLPSKIFDAELGKYWTKVCEFSLANPVLLCLEVLFSFLPYENCTYFHKLRPLSLSLLKKTPR